MTIKWTSKSRNGLLGKINLLGVFLGQRGKNKTKNKT